MSEDRFPELTACNAAAKAVEDFDLKHALKAGAIRQVAKMLDRGGWEVIRFRDETRAPLAREATAAEDDAAVSRDALRGDSIETIVMERRQLVQVWERAYAAVPEAIRTSARAPHGAVHRAMLRDRRPRR
jgi:hypothetical protein